MTIAQELVILDRAIAELGDDSYLGAWLKTQRGMVESMIRNDAAKIRNAARDQADKLLDHAVQALHSAIGTIRRAQ